MLCPYGNIITLCVSVACSSPLNLKIMYSEKFFQEQFALTGMQAADYAKAYHRLQRLLAAVDPLRKSHRNRHCHYGEEALELLRELAGVENEHQSLALLKKVFYKFAQSGRQEALEAARAMLSIRDSYIWPKDVYEDGNEKEAVPVKAKFSLAVLHSGHSKMKKVIKEPSIGEGSFTGSVNISHC